MSNKKAVGRPPFNKGANRVPLNSTVKPCTIDILRAWGKASGIKRGIYIDNLVEAEDKRLRSKK